MIDKLRNLFDAWMDENNKGAGEPLYAYEVYEFLDYIEYKIEAAERRTDADTISRQAAIDRAVSIPMFGRDIKMIAVSEVENLPSVQPAQRWIPCSERMPEHSYTKEFWIAVRTDNNRIKTLIGTWSSWCGRGKAYDAFDCWQDKLINGAVYRESQPIPKEKVIAWMPLPEPYERGERWITEKPSIG